MCAAMPANSGRAAQSTWKPVDTIKKSNSKSPLGVVTRSASPCGATARMGQPKLKKALACRDTRSVLPCGGGTFSTLM
ncbi:hypothetical protein D9M68_442900 [compost metagenome]